MESLEDFPMRSCLLFLDKKRCKIPENHAHHYLCTYGANSTKFELFNLTMILYNNTKVSIKCSRAIVYI